MAGGVKSFVDAHQYPTLESPVSVIGEFMKMGYIGKNAIVQVTVVTQEQPIGIQKFLFEQIVQICIL